MDRSDPELDYYRDVEDRFASLRGAPHVLSPRDFQLLRSWWRDGVPLSAVISGLTEVFARNRERDDADVISSLSYCRHAVRKHAKRFAEMHAGGHDAASTDATEAPRIDGVVDALDRAARVSSRRGVAEILERVREQIERAARELPAAALDEHLFAIESTMLAECWQALSNRERQTIERRVERAAAASTTDDAARRRTVRALRDRETRLLLSLPRLELDR
jgi:hypothetical protein